MGYSASSRQRYHFAIRFLSGIGDYGVQCIKQTGLPVLSSGFYKALKTMGMDPGLEFKVALEEAEKLNARSERDIALPHALALALATTVSLPVQVTTANSSPTNSAGVLCDHSPSAQLCWYLRLLQHVYPAVVHGQRICNEYCAASRSTPVALLHS